MRKSDVTIRRAEVADARDIHEAHMKSIREVCAKDYSGDDIAAWGGRPFDEAAWINSIAEGGVWVLEADGRIEGHGRLSVHDTADGKIGRVESLYLTPKVLGRGYGRRIMDCLLEDAEIAGVIRVDLDSTITSQNFYTRLGFLGEPGEHFIKIGGRAIRCFRMSKRLPIK